MKIPLHVFLDWYWDLSFSCHHTWVEPMAALLEREVEDRGDSVEGYMKGLID